MPELHNVIVFALAGARYAAELRWVREVITLGFVTEVPTAPAGLAGIFNLRGTIVPVIDLPALLGIGPPATPRQGDGALLLEADHAVAALRVDTIDEVGTLPVGTSPGTVIDARGRMVVIADPPALLRRAAAAAWAVRGIPPPDDDGLAPWGADGDGGGAGGGLG
ncbi:MAG: chemotaxis protein CheW [Kofleriaceae bacterium]|nr:chemotaxis protein CheW [Myxococcales bacterium]MCB9563215.1 chemotaxis protein CheW [Kofleriaceae bacterium]MCB9573602.1 chemotaxis protein CheW [Kofleriaceae bacterium]